MTLDRTTPPDIKEISGLRILPVVDETLPNGVKLVMLNQGDQPVNRITVFWTGGKLDVEEKAAFPLMTTLLNEGTPSMSGAMIAEKLESNGAWFSAETQNHNSALTLYSLNSVTPKLLPLLSEMIMQPIFPESTFESIREKQAAALEVSQEKVQTKARQLTMKLCYGAQHPAADLVTPEKIRKVERNDIVNLHRRAIIGVKPTVYLAGRLTPELISLVKDTFGKLPFAEQPDSVKMQLPPINFNPDGETEIDRVETSLQTSITISIPTILREHPDFEMLRFAVVALGGYFGSRLMSNIREDKGYTYGITAQLVGSFSGSFVHIKCDTDNAHAYDVIREVEHEIKRLAEEPMSEEELAIVRRTGLSYLAGLIDSPFSVIDYYASNRFLSLPDDQYNRQLSALETLTPEIICRMVSEHLLNQPRLIAMAGSPE